MLRARLIKAVGAFEDSSSKGLRVATAVRVITKESGSTHSESASVPTIAEILIDNTQRTQQIKKERRLLILSLNYIKQKNKGKENEC